MSNIDDFNIDLIKVDEIVITTAAIDNNAGLSALEKDNYYFDLTYGFSPGINISKKKIKILFSCDIKTFTNLDEKMEVSGRFDIAYFFGVENLEKLVNDGEGFLINPDLLSSLANIAYFTSRGIVYTRCQGTILKKVILPILSTQKLVEILQTQETNNLK